jgi:bifunctional DNA-binding transcriptional regulator/antitoxin component of YhaV-PrlF toxin-antitoxin module
MNVILDKFGRVLIPKPLRDRFGLTPGAELSLDVHEGGDGAPSLELRAVPDEPLLVRENGRLVYTGAIDPEGQDMVAFIKAQRLARASHIAGMAAIDPDDATGADAADARGFRPTPPS